MFQNIWIMVHLREDSVEEATFGLISEARRILSDVGEEGAVTAVLMCPDSESEEQSSILETLGNYGADIVLHIKNGHLDRYQGELFAKVLSDAAQKHQPDCILMAQNAETEDLCPRLAALLESPLVTRVMDFRAVSYEKASAIRPVDNGYLFEEVLMDCRTTPVISFLPSVLTAPEPDMAAKAEILSEPVEIKLESLKTKVVETIEADPEDVDIEEADIVVSGGRGVGKDEAFNVIHELARAIRGSVAGTRPVIDWQALPFERQIGQTGKTVAPRLLINCGISGANEYTAGIEKSQQVIAIDTNPRARIFRFADLGVVGDVHEVLPLLTERLKERGEGA